MKGKNLTRILMTILLVLISIAVIIIAFVGIYLPNLNKLKNIIPDYKLGTELEGIIEYRLVVDHSENEKEVYVDSNGNIKGEVKKDNNSNESVEVKTDLEQAEDTTNDTGYKIETRKIKVNNDDALTKENFEKK